MHDFRLLALIKLHMQGLPNHAYTHRALWSEASVILRSIVHRSNSDTSLPCSDLSDLG